MEYEADGFLEKNNDSLPLAVVSLFQTSSNQLVRMCFMWGGRHLSIVCCNQYGVYVHIYLYCIYKYKLPWQYKMATWTLPILLPVALQINIFFNKPEATDATLRHKPVLRRRYMKSGAFTDRGSSKLVACGLFLLYNVQSSKYCQKNVHTSEIHHS